MRRAITFFMMAVVLSAPAAFGQQEKGDVEVQVSFSVFKVEDFTSGFVQLKLGGFVSDNIQLGIAPSTQISSSQGETQSTVGLGLFASYSFLMETAAVPYLGLQYYVPDVERSDEFSTAGINLGIKYYFTEKAAFDLAGNILFSIQEEAENDQSFLLTGGISYLF
jgi:hypothetical protein